MLGGSFLGYGEYFNKFYNTYLGIEIFGNGTAASTSYTLSTPNNSYASDIKIKNNFGISLLPGVKLSGQTYYI